MNIRNPKKAFNPFYDKTHLSVPNPASWSQRVAKQQAYESRMYYHTLDCKNNGGRVYNTTLTYNDNALHDFFGFKVPESDDLRWLTHDSSFRRKLHKYYGVDRIDFFVGTELGEGKGKRGYHNNPHYHVIWFVYPVQDSQALKDFSYLDGRTFLRLVREAWQGVFYRYNGIKYSYEEMKALPREDRKTDAWKKSLKHPFLHDWQYARFGHVSTGRLGCEVTSTFGANTYASKYACKDVNAISRECELRQMLYEHYLKEAKYPNLAMLSDEEIEQVAQTKTKRAMNYYRAHHSTRVHCSHGLGESMKDFITDYMDPKVPYMTKDGIVERFVPQYIFRKVYRKLDENKSYVKNDLGQMYEQNSIQSNCDRTLLRVKNYYRYFRSYDASDLLSFLSKKDDFAGVTDYELMNALSYLDKELEILDSKIKCNWYDNVFTSFAVWKTFYACRSFDTRLFDGVLSPFDDYLLYSHEGYDPQISHDFLQSYSLLPCFAENLYYYNLLDNICEVRNQILDAEKSAEKARKDKLKKYYDDTFVFGECNEYANCCVEYKDDFANVDFDNFKDIVADPVYDTPVRKEWQQIDAKSFLATLRAHANNNLINAI